MSEDKPDYVTEALEMIGLTEPRQIITEVSGFIPVFEVVLHHYKDHMTALVFGRMWQYCNMSDGVCRASLDKIAGDLEISPATVMRHAEKLVSDEFLIDTTPDRRNAPHEYLDGRKVEMKGRISAGIAERKPSISQRNATVSQSQLIKQDNTIIDNKALSEKETEQANNKVDSILAMANFPGAKREVRIAAIQSYLGESFHRNTETKEWRKFAEYIDNKQQKEGQDVKVFTKWLFGQKNYDPQFWPVSKMMEFWPSAFVMESPTEEVRPEYQHYTPKEGNYVPRPAHLKPNIRKSP